MLHRSKSGRPQPSSRSLLVLCLLVADCGLAVRIFQVVAQHYPTGAWRVPPLLASALADADVVAGLRTVASSAIAAALAIAAAALFAAMHPAPARARAVAPRRGFTLVELLVVLVIVSLIAAAAIALVPGLGARQSSEAARLLVGALAGARDEAIHLGRPSGYRLIPDPAWPIGRLSNGQVDPSQPLACSRMVAVGPAPDYTEGAVTVRPGVSYAARIADPDGDPGNTGVVVPSLVLEAAPVDAVGVPLSPTAWAWNIRVGDRVQINGAGPWYCVVGPMWVGPAQGNTEMFVNWGPAGSGPALGVEWLVLTDGRDDNANGLVDEGWNGLDDNGNGLVDEYAEWLPNFGLPLLAGQVPTPGEVEAWGGSIAGGLKAASYAVRRRPMPTAGSRELALPTQVVIDLTTWATTQERSRLPVNRWTGEVEILVNPDGTVVPTTLYASPASFGMASAFDHFWLAERADVKPPAGVSSPSLAAPKGDVRIVTLNARSGRVLTTEDPSGPNPFAVAQQQ